VYAYMYVRVADACAWFFGGYVLESEKGRDEGWGCGVLEQG
jgi:hypothetical protein